MSKMCVKILNETYVKNEGERKSSINIILNIYMHLDEFKSVSKRVAVLIYISRNFWASLVAQLIKNPPAMQDTLI